MNRREKIDILLYAHFIVVYLKNCVSFNYFKAYFHELVHDFIACFFTFFLLFVIVIIRINISILYYSILLYSIQRG